MTEAEHGLAELDGNLTLSRDIRRACQLLEKLQKSKYCGEVRPVQCCSAAVCDPAAGARHQAGRAAEGAAV